MRASLLAIRLLLAAVVFADLAVLTAMWIQGSLGIPLIAVLGAGFVISTVAYTALTYRAHTEPHLLPRSMRTQRGFDADGIEYFFDSTGWAALSDAQAMTFIDAIVYPTTRFERISEQAEPFHRSLLVKSTYTVSVHQKTVSSDAPDYVVPLFLFPKGELQDGLRVFTGENERVSTLSSSDVLSFAAAVVRSLIHSVGGKAYANYLGAFEDQVLKMLTAEYPPTELELVDMKGRIVGLDPASGGSGILDTAAGLISELATYHPICVTIPAENVVDREWPWTFRFRMEYRTIPPLTHLKKEPWWRRFADWVRLAFGVRLNRLFIPIPNASRTNSYHLQVAGPPGTYLARQGTIPDESRLDARMKLQPRRSQRRAHLYVQEIDHPGEILFATQFFERAPGSFSTTTASAWAAAIVVTVLAIQQIHALDTGKEPVLSTLLPALLAVPIAVASWSGLDKRKEFAHPSLLSRFLTFATILVCLAVFAIAVAPRAYVAPNAIVWTLFAAAAIVLALLSTYSWILRLAIEHRFSKTGDDRE